jgi:predicted metalloprotease with PDZ domain
MAYVSVTLTAAGPPPFFLEEMMTGRRLRVSALFAGAGAEAASVCVGDELLAVGGYSAADFSGGAPSVAAAITRAKRPLVLLLWRDGAPAAGGPGTR